LRQSAGSLVTPASTLKFHFDKPGGQRHTTVAPHAHFIFRPQGIMALVRYAIEFNAGVGQNRIAALVACVGTYGTVTMRRADAVIELEVARPSRLRELGQRLAAWEREGLLSWRGTQ
jgi:hypothetical protein